MKPTLVYLIGEPGSGKSTLAAQVAIALGEPESVNLAPFAYEVRRGVALLGKSEGDFPGTDRLSMGVQPKVVEWMNTGWDGCIFGEGDRLATPSFFSSPRRHRLRVLWLDTPPDVCATRRAEREARMGASSQSSTWLKGRRTKIQGLVDTFPVMRLGWEDESSGHVAAILRLLGFDEVTGLTHGKSER